MGGLKELADAIKVTPQAVHGWLKMTRPVPAERCPLIEAATGRQVVCEELNGDIQWAIVRAPAAAEPQQAA